MTILSIAAALALAFLLLLRRYMLYVEPYRIAVTHHEVVSPRLPPKLDGAVLCHLSDLHISRDARNSKAIAQAVRSVKADLYAFTGDLIAGPEGVECFLSWVDDVGDEVRPAVVALGNAEHKEGIDVRQFVAALRSRGITVLMNQSARMPLRHGAELQIVGVDDPHSGHADFQAAARSLDPECFTLALCHSPDGLADPAFPQADLVLCGHTHGGQIRLPFLPVLWTNTRKVRGIVSGMYEGPDLARWTGSPEAVRRLYVSRGLGTGGCRARLFCPPELPVFTLRLGQGATRK